MHYPESTPVAVLPPRGSAQPAPGGSGSGAPTAAAAPVGGALSLPSAPPPFEYLRRTPMPAGAVETQGGCSCSGGCGAGCPCVTAHTEGLAALASPQHTVVTLLECGPACACAACEPAQPPASSCDPSDSPAAAPGGGGAARARSRSGPRLAGASSGGGGADTDIGVSSGSGVGGSQRCAARTSQAGVTARLAVAWYPGKGWGLQALAPLQRGAFICEYAGEPINAAAARARLAEYDAAGAGHALLVARLVLPSGRAALRLNLDATRSGNVARFANHACDGGNCELVFVTPKGELLPRVALFVRRGVAAGEELTFSYGSSGGGGGGGGSSSSALKEDGSGSGEQGGPGGRDAAGGGARRQRVVCACGAACCSGWMPSEEV